MANLTILRAYAHKEPTTFPSSILLSHSHSTLTLYDAYPKALFHFLILPRLLPPSESAWSANNLDSLKKLLQGDKVQAKEVITALSDEAVKLRAEIEDEMMHRYGFKWDVWTGFHAVPSMRHLHLHVISSDLVSEKLKNRKHYNSFHPELGFFLDIAEVLSWFDADGSYFQFISELEPDGYEKLLREPLACWRCGSGMKSMPTLKAHIQEEWQKLIKKETEKLKKSQGEAG